MKKILSQRQSEVLSLIRSSIDRDGESPTLTEMMAELGLSTKRSVAFHLDALEKKGYILRTGTARGIRLVGEVSHDFVSVPILGYANAGEPLVIAEEENRGELMVDKKIVSGGRKVFGLELKGDSMNNKILNGVPMLSGNYVIVAKDVEVLDNDVVLAIINDGATIKSLKRDGRTVVLYPDSLNPIHKPIYLDNTSESFIAGKVITVLSNPSLEN